MDCLQHSILLAILLAAVIMDFAWQKIKNWLIGAGLILGAGLRFYSGGMQGLEESVMGILFPVICLWILFLFRVLGAGDIKLFSVIGGFAGVESMPGCIAAAFILGAVLAAVKIIRNRNIISRLQYLAAYITKTISTKEIEPYYQASEGTGNIIHFSLAIFGGYLIYMEGFF